MMYFSLLKTHLLSLSNHFSYSQWFHWLGNSLCQVIWTLLVSSGGFGVGKLFCISLPQQPGRPPNSACCGWSRSENSEGRHLCSQCSARRQAKNHHATSLLPSFNLRKRKGTGNQICQAVVCECCKLRRYLYFSPWLIQMKRKYLNSKVRLAQHVGITAVAVEFCWLHSPSDTRGLSLQSKMGFLVLSLCFMFGTV